MVRIYSKADSIYKDYEMEDALFEKELVRLKIQWKSNSNSKRSDIITTSTRKIKNEKTSRNIN